MAERPGGHAPTPSALLELREERQVVREGYRFLDEKRLLLAAEILRQVEHYAELERAFTTRNREASAALAAAVERHGLDGVQVHPVAAREARPLESTTRRFLGVDLVEVRWGAEHVPPAPAALDPSPEARHCAELFADLVERSAELAAISGNLERLQREYRRTERRARALEDVILPEIETALAEIATRLEEMEQEEAVRVRLEYGQ